jgi:hypothetical protein
MGTPAGRGAGGSGPSTGDWRDVLWNEPLTQEMNATAFVPDWRQRCWERRVERNGRDGQGTRILMTVRTPTAVIEGPVVGGSHGWPFGLPLLDLADHGYVAEEFFVSGEASSYHQVDGTDWASTGEWLVEPHETLAFKTRILVYRPIDPAHFNGTVVVGWNNVTAGYELFGGESPEFFEGYAFVAATVQHVGVHGFPTNSQGLAAWDPQRYGSLSIPTDDTSYDIFTQVAKLVGADRELSGVDPLGGIHVERLIALGASQSASRLSTYINAIHPLENCFDGFLLQIYFGNASPIAAGSLIININTASSDGAPRPRLVGTNFIRTDLDVPVMVVNSELEAISCFGVRQPDTDKFCYWESAGTCHVAIQSMDVRAPKYKREFGVEQPVMAQMNRISIAPLYDAALHHLNLWVIDGTRPPSQPKIEFSMSVGAEGGAAEPVVIRDQHGIAVGGIRLPQADVPVAQNCAIPLGPDIYSLLWGASHPFSPEKLDSLYNDEDAYIEAFSAAAAQSVLAGVLLARDIPDQIEEARREYRRVRSM